MCTKKYSHVVIGQTTATPEDTKIKVDNFFSFSIANTGDTTCTVGVKRLEAGDSYSECNVGGLPFMGNLPLNWGDGSNAELTISYTEGVECEPKDTIVKQSFLEANESQK